MKGEDPKGFIEEKVGMSSEVQYTFFHRDSVAVLQAQINSVKNSKLNSKPAYSPKGMNAIDANLGTHLFPSVEKYIETSPDSSVTGNSRKSDGKQLFIEAVHLFTHKFQLSPTAELSVSIHYTQRFWI